MTNPLTDEELEAAHRWAAAQPTLMGSYMTAEATVTVADLVAEIDRLRAQLEEQITDCTKHQRFWQTRGHELEAALATAKREVERLAERDRKADMVLDDVNQDAAGCIKRLERARDHAEQDNAYLRAELATARREAEHNWDEREEWRRMCTRREADVNSLRSQLAAVAARLTEARDQLSTTREAMGKAQSTVCFFASVIKSGEPWTETCEKALADAS